MLPKLRYHITVFLMGEWKVSQREGEAKVNASPMMTSSPTSSSSSILSFLRPLHVGRHNINTPSLPLRYSSTITITQKHERHKAQTSHQTHATMYTHSSTNDFLLLGNHHHHHPLSPATTASPQLTLQAPPLSHLIVSDHPLAVAALEMVGYNNSSSSTTTTITTPTGEYSTYGSPNSLASCGTPKRPSLLQRSISSHSLQKNGHHCPFASPRGCLDMDISSVRRAFSTGDLQHGHGHGHGYGHRADSPLSSESSMIIESMTRACKYSPEEKKERIERYRSKRNQRNFNKKIKYACRKTLADSRPRIRGRFARNDEIAQLQYCNINGEEEEDDDNNWINLLDAFSGNSIP